MTLPAGGVAAAALALVLGLLLVLAGRGLRRRRGLGNGTTVSLDGVSISFPLYHGGSRSLKKSLLYRGSAGRIGTDAVRAFYEELERAGKEENDKLATRLDPITRLLRNEDPETARLAAFALARISGPFAAPAVPVLRRALVDPELAVQEQAASFLGEMGPQAEAAVGDLAAAVQANRPTSLRTTIASAPWAAAARADSGSPTSTITEIPSPSEMARLNRRSFLTR